MAMFSTSQRGREMLRKNLFGYETVEKMTFKTVHPIPQVNLKAFLRIVTYALGRVETASTDLRFRAFFHVVSIFCYFDTIGYYHRCGRHTA